MENELVTTVIEKSVQSRFAKTIVAAVAGFMASEVAKKGFDRVTDALANRAAALPQ